MARNRTIDSSVGWQSREFAKLWKAIRESSAAKRLQAATIGSGGLTVKDGGGIAVEDGGSVVVRDNGAFTATWPNGITSAYFGPLETLTGNPAQGVAVEDENGQVIGAFFRILPTDADPDGSSAAQFGDPDLSLGLFYVQAGDMQMAADNQAYMAGGNFSVVRANTDGVYLRGSIDGSTGVMIEHTTSAAAANCVIDATDGRIRRSTSSRRYKQDIEDATIDTDAVLALVPRQFRRKDEVEKLGDDAPVYTGFIAEEAADAGLHAWVTSDSEGPESFAYSTFVVAHQAVLRSLRDENADLRRRVEALESAEAKPTEG